MTPEEIQQQLLEAMQNMAEMTKRQFDLQEKQYKDDKDLNEKIKRGKETSVKDIQEDNKRLAKETEKRLGVEESTNKGLKKALDERQDIEKKVVERVKKQMGEEAFTDLQRNKFYKDQLEKYSQGTLAYGGVVTRFKDLDRQQQKALVDGAKTQNRLQQEQEKFAKNVQSLANPGQAIGEMKDKVSDLGNVMNSGKESLIKLAGGGIGATIAIEMAAGAAKVMGAALEGAAKAALGIAKSLVNGERGMVVGAKATTTFVQSITGAVKAFSDLAMGIGAFLLVISPFTGGLSAIAGAAFIGAGAIGKLGAAAADTAAELNQIAAEINDKLFAGFKELGKLSMTGAQGMTGVINNLHKMGLTVAEFDKFKSVIASNTKEMKMFGVTAEQGVNKFAEVAGSLYKSEMGKTLELMGISAEDQYEHTAKYLALQARLGLTQEKNSQNLAKSTKSYIEELDKIAEITGASRKEQEDARNAVMAIDELRAGILDEQRKIKEGTGSEQRLKELETAIKVATTLQQQGLTRQATGAAKYFGAGGAVTGTEAAEFFQAQQGVIKGVGQGKGAAELSVQALEDALTQAEKFAGVRKFGASTEGTGAGDKFSAYGDIAATLKDFKEAEAKRKATLEKEGKTYDRGAFMDEFLKERQARDKTTVQNVENNRKQMEVAIQLDKAVFKYNESVGINKMATDLFKKAVDKFGEYTDALLGKTKPTGAAGATGAAGDTKAVDTQTNKAIEAGDRLKTAKEELHRLEKDTNASREDIEIARKKVADLEKERVKEEAKVAQASREMMQARLEQENRKREYQKQVNIAKQMGKEIPPPPPGLSVSSKGVVSISGGTGKTIEGTGDLSGLTIKRGDVHKEGAKLDPKIIEIAKKVQEQIPGFSYFSSFNDNYHTGMNSKHAKGKAFDFVLDKEPTPEEGKAIISSLKGMGADHVIDEYHNPTSRATGGHIHAEIQGARLGGMFTGPEKGYPVELHGKESVWPEHKLQELLSSVKKQSIDEYKNNLLDNTSKGYPVELHGKESVWPEHKLQELLSSVKKQSIDEYKNNLLDNTSNKNTTPAVQASNMNDFASAFIDLKEMLSQKFDAMVDKLEDIHGVEDQILKNARA